MRVDANVSVRPVGSTELGTRAEIKNVNSLRSLGRAIEYEIERQIELLESGERVVQETRHWDEDGGRTRSGRSKEEAHDYRYFPEPDLVPVAPTDEHARAGARIDARAAGRAPGAPRRATGASATTTRACCSTCPVSPTTRSAAVAALDGGARRRTSSTGRQRRARAT